MTTQKQPAPAGSGLSGSLGPLPAMPDSRRYCHDAAYSADQMRAYAAQAVAAERERMLADGWRKCASGQRTSQFCGELEAAVAAERERIAGGNNLEAMCEAFHRLIEAHANVRSPFHQPVCADAQMALRVLRGIAAELSLAFELTGPPGNDRANRPSGAARSDDD